MTRFLKGLGSLAVLAGLLAGAPWLLLRVGQLGMLAHLGWHELVRVPDTGAFLLAVMTLVAWLAWAVLVASVLVEVAALLSRGRVRVRIPGAGWAQPVAAALVLGVAGMFLAPAGLTGAVAHAATPEPPPAGASQTATASDPSSGRPSRAGQHTGGVKQGHPGVARGEAGAQHGQPGHEAAVTHVVRHGDDLWSLAEQYYGDGLQWRRIAADNHLDAGAVLAVGTTLHLPGATDPDHAPHAAQAAPAKDTAASPTVVVEPGDSLSEIAADELGDADRWPEIERLNESVITDPDVIQPGWRLQLPAEHAQEAPAPATPGTHTSRTAPGTSTPSAAGASGSTAGGSTAGTAPSANPSAANQPSVKPPAANPTQGRAAPTATPEASSSPRAGAGSRAGAAAPGDAVTTAPSAPASAAAEPSVARSSAAAPVTGPAATASGVATSAPSSSAAGAVPAQSTPAAAGPVAGEDLQPTVESQESDPAWATVGGLGVLLCAALAGAVALRRREQLARRVPGRRIVLPGAESLQFENALGRVASQAPEPPEEAGPTAVLLGQRDEELVLHDLEAAAITSVQGDPELVASLVAAATTGLVLQPWSAETSVVVQGDLPWVGALDEPQVSVVTDVEQAVARLEHDAAARRVALARLALANGHTSTLGELREDPDLWEAWRPQVHVFAAGLTQEQAARVSRALAGDPLGLSALVAGPALLGAPELAPGEGALPPGPGEFGPGEFGTGQFASSPARPGLVVDAEVVEVLDEHSACIDDGPRFSPHLVDATARRALFDLFDTASSDRTTPAPWWSEDDDLPPNLTVLQRRPSVHLDEEAPVDAATASEPTLLLLGPIDLIGCRGEEPTRARRQCMEYCAWLHQHPGLTATAMSRQLLVAEGTRRSNMSRLRTWLGADANGDLYLPDAYSGRIQLHPAVSTDWEHLQLLVAAGVNRSSTDALVDALRLVRGAPLADAAPGQWNWAEELRTDMASTIRDIAVVLAGRALDENDLDLARWAASRGLAAAPQDELLMCARLRTEHLAGNRPEVERLVLHITRHARAMGSDLDLATVELLQEVMEGRRRARLA